MNWFSNLGQLAKLMKDLPHLREQLGQLRERLEQIVGDGDAGAGMVKVRINGRLTMISCTISPEALALNDREMLEDLIKAASNQALEKARQMIHEETSKLLPGMGMLQGMNLPGMDGV